MTPQRFADIRMYEKFLKMGGQIVGSVLGECLDEIDRLRSELDLSRMIEASDELRGFLMAHGGNGELLVVGEFANGKEFKAKYRVAQSSPALVGGGVPDQEWNGPLLWDLLRMDSDEPDWEDAAKRVHEWFASRLDALRQPTPTEGN